MKTIRFYIDLIEQTNTQIAVNSLGQPIANTQEGLNNFKSWFRKSKIVDARGNPLVLYHGTLGDFKSFSPREVKVNQPHYRESFFFTNMPDVAQTYAGQKTERWQWKNEGDDQTYHDLLVADKMLAAKEFFKKNTVQNVKTWNEGANLKPVYLRMEKPLRASGKGNYWNEIYYDGDYITTRDLIEIAAENGHDGIIVKNVHDRREGHGKPSTIYAVLEPNQIKSALGNNGTFGQHDIIDEQDD